MIARAVRRFGYRLSVALLLLAIGGVGGYIAVVAVPDLAGLANRTLAPASASPQPSAQSAMARSPIGIAMPADTDCNACHLTTNGVVGTKTIPAMAHPLWGWQNCTACHTTGSLVASAPGHTGLHKDDCLVCHRPPDATTSASPPPFRPEHMGGDQACTACHGVDQHAPMPETMKGRGDNCWICHNGPEFKYLFDSPAPSGSGGPGTSAAPEGSIVPGPSSVAYQLATPTPAP
jgi:hypothetical protein